MEHHFLLCHHHGGDVAPGADMSLVVAWNELGNPYLQNNNTAESEDCFLHSIDALRVLDGADKYSISMPRINLGIAYWVGGKLNEAL